VAISTGSGLAIGGAAATVVAAGVASYFIIMNPASQETVTKAEPIAQPAAAPQSVQTQPEAKIVTLQPKAAEPEAEPAIVILAPPSFDLIRVDKTGSTVVAGKAAAGTTVEIMLEGKLVGQTLVDSTGAFVALLDLEPSDRPRELTLLQKQAAGEDIASIDKVLVMPLAPKAKKAPKLVVAKADTGNVEVIEPAQTDEAESEIKTETSNNTPTKPVIAGANSETAALSLDTIVYDSLGDVVISGRGNSDNFVRIYLDNKPANVEKVTDKGQWEITLADVPSGLYSLRVDSVNSAGSVTQRVLSPFKREAAQVLAENTNTKAANITIQPGFTLWAVAQQRYGSGVRYVQIFEANRDRIKNPDLIYPGQVFDLPN